jgi:tight adherence protein C
MFIPLILGAILLLFLVTAVFAFFIVEELARAGRLSKRLDLAIKGREEVQEEAPPHQGPVLLQYVSKFGFIVARSGALSGKTIAEMTATLEALGFRGGRGLGLFIGAKVLLMIIVPMIAYMALNSFFPGEMGTIMLLGGGVVVGMMAPESIANYIRTKHLKQVQQGVADSLDMMVICADAGLALEAGLARVAQEMVVLNPALSQELTQTSRELQIGSNMRQAMESLGARTGLDPLKRLATTLTQSLQYGTPLTAALRTLSTELRDEALVAFEERAGRLPTLMTIPMILFILPCVFLIVAGPAIINVLATLHGQQ